LFLGLIFLIGPEHWRPHPLTPAWPPPHWSARPPATLWLSLPLSLPVSHLPSDFSAASGDLGTPACPVSTRRLPLTDSLATASPLPPSSACGTLSEIAPPESQILVADAVGGLRATLGTSSGAWSLSVLRLYTSTALCCSM
jgi:hypothetical protein